MNLSSGKYIGIILILFFSCFMQLDVSAQCAMCKQAAETSLKSNPKSLARGLNSGILYLMAIPYVAIAFIFRKQLAQVWKKLFKKPIKRPVA